MPCLQQIKVDVIMIKVIIAGGRHFKDYNLLVSKLHYLLQKHKQVVIVSGKAKGADYLGEVYARDFGHIVEEYPADWDKHGKSAGYKRNTEMAKNATHLVAFWDGKSKGTKHMIDIATARGLKAVVVKY